MIRVLLVIGHAAGGVRKHVHTILRGLSEDNEFQFGYVYSALQPDLVFQKEIADFRSVLLDEMPLNVTKVPAFGDLRNAIRIYSTVRDKRYDLIHGHGAKGGLYARVVAALIRTASAYTPHGGVIHDRFERLPSKVYWMAETLLQHVTSRYIFESNYSKLMFESQLGTTLRNSVVNPNGVAVASASVRALSKRSEVDGKTHFGVFGRLCHEKGQRRVLETLASCRKDLSSAIVHFFGIGPEERHLRAFALSESLGPMAVFHGESSDVESEMMMLDAVIVPSVYESFGYVAAEALACGVPVLASRTGGLAEILDENCTIFFNPNAPDEIAQALSRFIRSPELSRRLAENGRRKISECYSESKMLENLRQIYRETVVQSRGV
jgi:glycosyltransferase involved in cell wall biosynthesis